jgi:hypothetical protein
METNFIDHMVFSCLVVGMIVFVLVVIWGAIVNDKSQQLYKVIKHNNDGPEIIKAGLMFAEAIELFDALRSKYPEEYFSVMYDSFAS